MALEAGRVRSGRGGARGVAAYLLYRWTYTRRMKRKLVGIARWKALKQKNKPNAHLLRLLGEAFEMPSKEGETGEEYGKRVFGVDEFDQGAASSV